MKSLCLAILLACVAALAQAPSGMVEGTVVHSTTGAGIADATVTLIGPRPSSARFDVTSDAAGQFKFTGVAPGTYRAGASKDGFSAPMLDLAAALKSGFEVTAASPVKIQLKLTPFDSVSGRILGPDARPLAGVEVVLLPDITADVEITDAEGRFAFPSVRPGSYRLLARAAANAPPAVSDDGSRSSFIATYYEPIVVGGQQHFDNIEVRMQSAPVYSMRGVVLDAQGKPASKTDLTLYPAYAATHEPLGLTRRPTSSVFVLGLQRAPYGTAEATAHTDAEGHFEFSAVPSGTWRIKAETTGAQEATATALIARQDLENVEVRLTTPISWTADIAWKNAAPARFATKIRMPSPIALLNAETNVYAGAGILENDSLQFENLIPGPYKILVMPGFAEIAETVTVSSEGPRVRFVLSESSGTIRGTVERGDTATVVLLPRRTDGVVLGQTVTCGPGGAFELNEVSPGDYTIAAFDRVDGLGPSADILNLLPSRGTSVRVENGAATSVRLAVIPTPR